MERRLTLLVGNFYNPQAIWRVIIQVMGVGRFFPGGNNGFFHGIAEGFYPEIGQQ